MQVGRHQFGREASDLAELLAMSRLRRSLEPEPAVEHDPALVAEVTSSVAELKATMHQLTELIAAIDRRLPQVQRSGESAIANAATRLRDEAEKRIGELEGEVAGREPVDPRPRASV
jgi:uncharacterized coiled-coil protein SlyX